MPILKPKQPRQAPPSPVKTTSRTTLLVLLMGMVFGILAPASAQFFGFGFPNQPPRPQRQVPQQQPGFGGFFAPFETQQPKEVRPVDYSRAPAPKKQEFPPERSVLVLGDAMADWLAYGLEDAFAENNDLGVIRRHKTVSGLIRYQPKGDPADWAAAAKGILAKEKPDAIVVMLGLHDRTAIRETIVEKKKDDPAKKDAKAKPGDAKPGDVKPGEAKPDAKATDAKSETNKPETKPDGAPGETSIAAKPEETKPDAEADADDEQPQIAAPERGRAGALHEFREERWVELYTKKIDEMIAVVKSKGVPVLWVGLPALRGPKGTSDMLFLTSLYRDAAGRAGITYVDVWDGFVDESGRFMQQGPDFEGQTRRLRTPDGVFFTKPGARKLAHYTDREIRRLLASRTPIALPVDPGTPDPSARPDAPAGPTPRPLAGPVLPLVASSIRSDELLGGTGTRPAAIDALAARTLVKGEAIASIAGRADDASWPRREIGRLEPGATPPTPVAVRPASPSSSGAASIVSSDPNAPGATPPKPRRPRIQQTQPQSPGGFFGFTQPAPQPQVQPQRPRFFNPGAPRPPGSVGPSASAPGGGFFR